MNRPRKMRRELVENELLERAAELFGTRGFNGTTLQDVADTVGLTRATFYHYFDSKEALLAALVEDIAVARATEIKGIRSNPSLSAAIKLAAVTRMMVLNVTSQAARFRLLLQTENELPPDLATKYARGRRETLKELVALFEEGFRSGDLRPMEPHLAAFALLGMCNWTAWWFNPEHQSAEAVADQFSETALAAYALPQGAARQGGGIGDSIQRMRDELAQLERLTQTEKS